ncbi:MAG: hypothetical protein ACPGLV_11845 [Bacteroidia bacterium]
MKQFLKPLVILLVCIASCGTYTFGQGKWPTDTSFKYIHLNTGYSAPAFHLGFQIGVELPIKRTYKTFTPLRFLKHFGLKKLPKNQTIYRQTSFEPFMLFYNHKFNHSNLSIGAAWHYRIEGPTRFYGSVGFEVGRAFQFYRDAIVFDDRGQPSEQFITSNGYYQLGFLFEIGYIFNKPKHQSIYYRAHVGTLFPYNHVLNAYLRNELGLKIISLR